MLNTLRTSFALLLLLPHIIANPIASPDNGNDPSPGVTCHQVVDPDQPDLREVHFHRQLTDKISCNAAKGCSTTHLEQNTFSYEVSAGANTPFNSLGFGVTEEYTTGDEYQCEGDQGDTVCVWVNVKNLEYHVAYTGDCDVKGEKSTIRAPESGQGDGDFYCVTGDACRTKGEGYWEEDQ